MEKRYQVFISSTFSDLKDERQAVLRAILELDHMPAGMELFPAADATAWQIIKDVIDASDYYVLVIGGRYGSLDESGLSYTEKEYDYSVATKKPVIPFLHRNPDNLPRDRTETDEGAWEKLKQFRAKVESRHTCVYWDAASDLKAAVIVGLTSTMKRAPAVGWVRADKVPTDATVTEILKLRKTISDLEVRLEADRTAPPQGTEELVQGEDPHEIPFRISTYEKGKGNWAARVTHSAAFEVTWNEIFAAVGPSMINEASDTDLKAAFRSFFKARGYEHLKEWEPFEDRYVHDLVFDDDDIDTCIVQVRALGLIRENQKPRSVKDTQTYWSLTPYGDQVMTQLRAIRKSTRGGAKSDPDRTPEARPKRTRKSATTPGGE